MSIQRRVKSLEQRLSQGGPMIALVTLEEYDAMVRDACERVLASQPDDRTRALVDAVLGAENWTLVMEEFEELNLHLQRPPRFSDWPPGKPFRYLLDYPEAASVEEWLEMVHREKDAALDPEERQRLAVRGLPARQRELLHRNP